MSSLPRSSSGPGKFNGLLTSQLENESALDTWISNTPCLELLQPDNFEEQLTVAAQDFVNQNVTVDESKRTIHIPKVCEVFRNDFCPTDNGGVTNAAVLCLHYCMNFLNDDLVAKIQDLMQRAGEGVVSVKFQPTAEQYLSSLRWKTIEVE